MRSLMRRQVVFTLGMLVFGCLEAVAAYSAVGFKGLEGVGCSLLLCIIPGWLTIFASDFLKHPDVKSLIVLVGTGLRMVFVLAGMFVMSLIRPDLGVREFVVWLIAGYLVSLALETWIVVASSNIETAA